VRLASQLTGWDIDIVSETEDSERRAREFHELTELFMNELNVEEVIAQLLATEGFTTVDELAYAEVEELAQIQGFDEEIAQALHDRAVAWVEERDEKLRQAAAELGIADDLMGFERLDLQTIVALGRAGIRSLEDFADLAVDELVEMLPQGGLTQEIAGDLIMDARMRLGWIEPPAAEPAGEELAEQPTG
jgi:N utilization substance protein A